MARTRGGTERDFLGRVVAATRPAYGGGLLVTSNAYDNSGRVIAITALHVPGNTGTGFSRCPSPWRVRLARGIAAHFALCKAASSPQMAGGRDALVASACGEVPSYSPRAAGAAVQSGSDPFNYSWEELEELAHEFKKSGGH